MDSDVCALSTQTEAPLLQSAGKMDTGTVFLLVDQAALKLLCAEEEFLLKVLAFQNFECGNLNMLKRTTTFDES